MVYGTNESCSARLRQGLHSAIEQQWLPPTQLNVTVCRCASTCKVAVSL